MTLLLIPAPTDTSLLASECGWGMIPQTSVSLNGNGGAEATPVTAMVLASDGTVLPMSCDRILRLLLPALAREIYATYPGSDRLSEENRRFCYDAHRVARFDPAYTMENVKQIADIYASVFGATVIWTWTNQAPVATSTSQETP